MGRPTKVEIGKTYGYLTVIERSSEYYINPSAKSKVPKYLCECNSPYHDKPVRKLIKSSDLVSGHAISCGCVNKHNFYGNRRVHGMSSSHLYFIYKGMIYRCYNPNSYGYNLYGGRGITVCNRWHDKDQGYSINIEKFNNFLEDMGSTYQEGLSLDRIDPNGNYEPSNCRWATNIMQANNKNSNVYLTYNNETHTIAEWSRIRGYKDRSLISQRLKKGYTVEEALNGYDHSDRCIFEKSKLPIKAIYFLDKYGNYIDELDND